MLLLVVFAAGGLLCFWIWGDASARTKWILTTLYFASWGVLFLPPPNRSALAIVQSGFAILFGGMTFGIDWLMRDAWHVR